MSRPPESTQEQYWVAEVDETWGPTLQEFLNRAWADGWRTMQVVPRGGLPYRWTVMLERRDPGIRYSNEFLFSGREPTEQDYDALKEALRGDYTAPPPVRRG